MQAYKNNNAIGGSSGSMTPLLELKINSSESRRYAFAADAISSARWLRQTDNWIID